MPDKKLILTDEEIKAVNDTIKNIQSDLEKVIEHIKNNDFDSALLAIRTSLEKTDCPICQKKLKLLKADISHTKEICPIDADLCIEEKKQVSSTAIELKDEFVPIATEKKAIRDKTKEKPEEKRVFPFIFPTPLEILESLRSK